MQNATRVIVNTISQYVRTIINLCLSLYSTRLLLTSLGVTDYGIFTLIAGVVYLLSFAINALVVTTQRYMSFYNGMGNTEKLKEIFCNSLFIHVFLGLTAAIIVSFIGLFLFDGALNISAERIDAAKIVYNFVVVMLTISFISAPFRALLIAHENLVYVSFIDIVDGILKVVIVIFVSLINYDKLIYYSGLLCLIQVFEFFAFSIYDYYKFEECVFPKRSYFNKKYIGEISSFAGWTIYSIGCITGRSQGLSILINKFIGVVANAAYGIAIQVNGAMLFLSQSLLNALNPQIMKAEGCGDRNKMLRLSEIESKYSFLLISMISIPCMFEMDSILYVWLGNVPEGASLFCRFILLATMIDQLTIGLGTANQAIGAIKSYSLSINTIKIFSLIPILTSLYFGCSLFLTMSIYVLIEFVCCIMRLFFLKYTAGLSLKKFCKNVFLKELFPILFVSVSSLLVNLHLTFNYSFLLTIVTSIIVMGISILCFALSDDEKMIFVKLYRKII